MSSTTQLARTPLHDWHEAHGGRMVDFTGWSMPVQYTSIVQEHQATRSAVGLFDISHMGRLTIEGPGAAEALDGLLTRKVLGMKPGQIRYSLVCNESGGILDDVLVYLIADDQPARYLMVVNASNREKIVTWLTSRLGDSVCLKDVTNEQAMIAVQGPRAVELMGDLFQCELASYKYYTGKPVVIDGVDCYLSRTGYTGEDGCEILCPSGSALPIWEKLATAAEKIGGQAAGLAARDTLRLEAAMPLYGHELSETIDPVQAGLGFALSLKDRQFVGRDAIAKIRDEGPQQVRIGLQLEGRRVAREGSAVLQDEQEIGTVTSGTFSPTLERPIAMAYVPNDAAAVGTQLSVDIRGKQVEATVVALPFYQRKK